MASRVWVDAARCTGCGACLDACRPQAIALINGKAQVNAALCTGCEACIKVCPEGALVPTLEGEIVIPEAPSRTMLEQAAAARRPAPLAKPAAQSVAAVAVAAGTGLLLRGLRALAEAAGRWLLQAPGSTGTSTNRISRNSATTPRPLSSASGGRQLRQRQRGRR